MEHILEKSAVKRVAAAMDELSIKGPITVLGDSARTAQDAASALGIEVGQIASSLVVAIESIPTGLRAHLGMSSYFESMLPL